MDNWHDGFIIAWLPLIRRITFFPLVGTPGLLLRLLNATHNLSMLTEFSRILQNSRFSPSGDPIAAAFPPEQLAIEVRKYCSHIDLAIVFFRMRSVRGAGYQQTTVIHDLNKCYPSEATAAATVGSALRENSMKNWRELFIPKIKSLGL